MIGAIRQGLYIIGCDVQAKARAGSMCHLVDVQVPDAKRVVVVQDNLNMHTLALYSAFPPARPNGFGSTGNSCQETHQNASRLTADWRFMTANTRINHKKRYPILKLSE